MFDVDQFVADCMAAADETEPRLAVREVMSGAFEPPADIRQALPSTGPRSSRSTARRTSGS